MMFKSVIRCWKNGLKRFIFCNKVKRVEPVTLLAGSFPFVFLALRQQGCVLHAKKSSKISPQGVQSSFRRAELRLGKETPAGNTAVFARALPSVSDMFSHSETENRFMSRAIPQQQNKCQNCGTRKLTMLFIVRTAYLIWTMRRLPAVRQWWEQNIISHITMIPVIRDKRFSREKAEQFDAPNRLIIEPGEEIPIE